MRAFPAFTARLGALPWRVRIVGVVGALLAAGAIGLALLATRDLRLPLFATPLYPDQLSEVETRLAAWRIAYAPLADNVRVDPRARSELLLRLALAGVPHRHLTTSDEAFAHVGALTPQSVLEAQTRDALAADLARGLRGLAGVADASVIVAPASAGVFADEPTRDASASVRITLEPGAHVSATTVGAIRAFVAGGVPGLDPARVTVLDDSGALDGRSDPDDEDVQGSLQSALDAVYGSGATIVRVHREPLGEQRTDDDVKRLPITGDLTRVVTDERYANGGKRYAKVTSDEARGNETHEVQRTLAPEATARLSVAIFVDGSKNIDLDAIRDLAAAAAGIDPARGDLLRVEAVRFGAPRTVAARGLDGWAIAGLFAGIIPQGIVAAGLIVVLALGARPLYRLALRALEAASVRGAAREAAGLPPARVRGALAGEPPHVAAAVISALPAATATAVLELYPPEERAQIVRRLARAAVDLVPRAEELVHARG